MSQKENETGGHCDFYFSRQDNLKGWGRMADPRRKNITKVYGMLKAMLPAAELYIVFERQLLTYHHMPVERVARGSWVVL